MSDAVPARIALDAHTGLLEFLNHPPALLVDTLDAFVTKGAAAVRQRRRGGLEGLTPVDRVVVEAWDYYMWPAKTGADLLRLAAAPLASALTYQVTTRIVNAVTGMYGATAAEGPAFRKGEIPSPAGFAWLDEPFTFTDFSGVSVTARAMSWGPMLFRPPGTAPAEGTRVTVWTESDLVAYRTRSVTGPGTSNSLFIPYGQPTTGAVTSNPARWLHCLWLFMGTEIVVKSRERPERPSRRRAERAGLGGEVTVIMLPRRNYPQDGHGHRDVNWSCCWVVQGHDRHLGDYQSAGFEPHHAMTEEPQEPCSVCGARTTRVRSYVKGPDGLPLKADDKVFRVA